MASCCESQSEARNPKPDSKYMPGATVEAPHVQLPGPKASTAESFEVLGNACMPPKPHAPQHHAALDRKMAAAAQGQESQQKTMPDPQRGSSLEPILRDLRVRGSALRPRNIRKRAFAEASTQSAQPFLPLGQVASSVVLDIVASRTCNFNLSAQVEHG